MPLPVQLVPRQPSRMPEIVPAAMSSPQLLSAGYDADQAWGRLPTQSAGESERDPAAALGQSACSQNPIWLPKKDGGPCIQSAGQDPMGASEIYAAESWAGRPATPRAISQQAHDGVDGPVGPASATTASRPDPALPFADGGTCQARAAGQAAASTGTLMLDILWSDTCDNTGAAPQEHRAPAVHQLQQAGTMSGPSPWQGPANCQAAADLASLWKQAQAGVLATAEES